MVIDGVKRMYYFDLVTSGRPSKMGWVFIALTSRRMFVTWLSCIILFIQMSLALLAKRMRHIMPVPIALFELIEQKQHLRLQTSIPLHQQLILLGQTAKLVVLHLQLVYPLPKDLLCTAVSRFLFQRKHRHRLPLPMRLFGIFEEKLDLPHRRSSPLDLTTVLQVGRGMQQWFSFGFSHQLIHNFNTKISDTTIIKKAESNLSLSPNASLTCSAKTGFAGHRLCKYLSRAASNNLLRRFNMGLVFCIPPHRLLLN